MGNNRSNVATEPLKKIAVTRSRAIQDDLSARSGACVPELHVTGHSAGASGTSARRQRSRSRKPLRPVDVEILLLC